MKDERERTARESGCCMPARVGGLNKVERGAFVLDARREERRPIEGAEGRQSSHLALKRRLRALFHSSIRPPPSSSFFPSLLHLLSVRPPAGQRSVPLHAPASLRSILRHLFTGPSSLHHVLFVFARLVNASRPQRTLHTQLFTGRLSPSPSTKVKVFSQGTGTQNSSSDGETPRYGGQKSFPLSRAIRSDRSSREIYQGNTPFLLQR